MGPVDKSFINPDTVLDDFERLPEIGEAVERGEETIDEVSNRGAFDLLFDFLDRHGRQLLDLARTGRDAL